MNRMAIKKKKERKRKRTDASINPPVTRLSSQTPSAITARIRSMNSVVRLDKPFLGVTLEGH